LNLGAKRANNKEGRKNKEGKIRKGKRKEGTIREEQ
jgi:hypothetical protein